MPRAKKKTTTTTKTDASAPLLTEDKVARLFVDLLDVYKNSCKNDIVGIEMSRDQKVAVAKTLEAQSDVIKSKCFSQVSGLFKE